MPYIVGVDFDNTLVSYDDVMHRSAVLFGFIDKDVSRSKRNIRDEIRRLPDGEMKWRKLQAFVYGERMNEARLMEGVKDFFGLCKKRGIRTYIVSHKTKFAAADEKEIDLRQAALEWMNTHGFFDEKGLGLSAQDVYFEGTRKEKAERIKALRCTHFIDDLEEIFLEKSFPARCAKILYSSQRVTSNNCHSRESGNPISGDMTVMRNWKEIYDHFFNDGRQ